MSLLIPDKETPQKPCIGDTWTIYLRNLKDAHGAVMDLSGASIIYMTAKDALSDADDAAALQIDTTAEPTQFVTTYASTGNLDATFTSTNTATLTADLPYYVDIKAIWASGVTVSLVHDTVIWQQRVTRATS